MDGKYGAWEGGHLAAIYVHAGAGYHSRANEDIHLDACAKAAKLGMAVMRAGGSSLDAVEMAIKCLEDNDVTNAGYGSNLTMDGTVEGDATIVDHLGRSGAVGALANIRNPICVARLVHEESTRPMVLKRVPPNLLTGPGATNFALNHGLELEPNKNLISPGAQDRFRKWRVEIEMAKQVENLGADVEQHQTPKTKSEFRDIKDALESGPALSQNPVIAALANESQSFSPDKNSKPSRASEQFLHRANSRTPTAPLEADRISDTRKRDRDEMEQNHEAFASLDNAEQTWANHREGFTALQTEDRPSNPSSRVNYNPHRSQGPMTPSPKGQQEQYDEEEQFRLWADEIIDTVGAIAIDSRGRIAAASSSGGIGMKHPGRTGPAALVGIGTAVIPVDPDDTDRTTVACVTSGTGEHMATTLAAHTCAQRLYTGTKSVTGGRLVDTDEDDAIKNFVQKDFMGHPSIKASFSQGAIGLMLVKKSREGMWLYWVHNTESFALASMHAGDAEPHTAMSRSTKAGRVVTGARSMRLTDAGTATFTKTKRSKGAKSAKAARFREAVTLESSPSFRLLPSGARRRRQSANPTVNDTNTADAPSLRQHIRRDLDPANTLDDEEQPL